MEVVERGGEGRYQWRWGEGREGRYQWKWWRGRGEGRGEGEVSLKVVERGGEGLQTAHLLHKRFTMSTLPTAVA